MARNKSGNHVPPRPPVQILIAEDDRADAELVTATLVKAGYRLTFDIADTPGEFRRRIRGGDYDIILADFNMGSWTAIDALGILSETGKDIPLIVVTGTLGDEAAVDCIKRGAADYVLKNRLDRLPAVFGRALREKAQREEAVRLQEQIWRAKHDWELTFDTVSDPVVILGEDCRIQRANRAAAELLGLPFQRLIGGFCYEVLHGSPQPRPDCPHQIMLQSGHEERNDMAEPHLGKVFEAAASPLRGDSGKLLACVHVLRDITERKRAEEVLRETNETLRALIQASPLGIVLLDPDGNVKLWNPASERMFGWTEAEVLGRPLPIIPEGKKVDHRALRERVLRGEEFSVEVQRQKKDGSRIDVSVSTAAIRDAQGNVHGALGIMEDISERKRTEEERARLTSAVEQAAEAVLITDPEGTIVYVNPAFERITGYNRKEVLGRNPRLLKTGKQDAAFYQAMWATLARGEHWSGHFSNKRKDGGIYEGETVISPVRDGTTGQVVNYVAVQRDVTLEQELEVKLRRSQKMEAIGRLAGGIAHDFNNLLTAISGYSDLLLVRPADERQRRQIEEIKKAGERAASLTRRLMALGRRQELAPEVIDLNAAVARIEKMLQSVIGEDIEMATCPAPELGRVKADAGQIEQVILNLVLNARDALPKGGKLVVETANVELSGDDALARVDVTPGRYVMLAVTDMGCGMDAEVLSHIFEPFFTTKGEREGSGLGLATVYGIVKQSGGHLEVSSEPGRGTRFEVCLPRFDAPLPPKALTATAAAAADIPGGRETILLVEDEEMVRVMLREILQDCGYEILEASGALPALSLLERYVQPIHLVLTDVVMPRLSGWELADRLEPWHPESKVIFMSGYNDHRVALRGVVDSGAPYLRKPFTAQALATKVREVLDKVPAGTR